MRRVLWVAGALLATGAWARDKAPEQPTAPPPPETRTLKILQKVMPTYTGEGIGDGGCVTVKFVIKPDGFVGDIEVLEAKPEALAEPTIAALKQWWFQSFPPPEVSTVQTFNFAPERVKLPDNAIRAPYAVASEGGLTSVSCGQGKDGKGAKP